MKIINNLLILLIWILNIFSIVFNISFNYEVNILICISLSIIVVLPRLLKKYIKLSEISEFIFLIFIILAGELGSVLKLYEIVYWYDSFTHFLSGILTAYLGFLILKKEKLLNKKNSFNILFIISFVLAIAAFWEIFEFTADNIFCNDAQRVLETGVTDTMKDIICALFGGILFIVAYLYKRPIISKK